MRFETQLRAGALLIAALSVSVSALGQDAAPPFSSSKAPPAIEAAPPYCDQQLGFCVKLPAGWKELGEAYEGRGLVFAPPQTGDQSLWAQFTVAGMEAQPREGQEPASLENLVTVLLGQTSSQAKNMRTLRRSETEVGGRAAQVVELRYDDNGQTWAEIVSIVDAGEGQFYTLAFKSLARDRDRYKAAVDGMIGSFSIIE